MKQAKEKKKNIVAEGLKESLKEVKEEMEGKREFLTWDEVYKNSKEESEK